MAAAAKAPGPADARIPCPLCGGLIHPIAGRCKHCKGDVGSTRSSKPAQVALPALHGGASNGHSNGHAVKQHPANAHMPLPLAVRSPADEASQVILPPRQTGRMAATGTASSQASWKSWPVVVIGIAVLAIIAAVILMVWPHNDSTKADAKTLAPPPAPERMDTNPLPPQGSIDPWKNTPSPPAQPSPPSADPDPDPPNLADPFRDPGPNSADKMAAMMGAVMKHACDRLQQCPNASASDVQTLCALGQMTAPASPAPTCSAARRCLAAVDALPCDDIDQTAAMKLMTSAQDCLEAISC
jgi:hypothetical protein